MAQAGASTDVMHGIAQSAAFLKMWLLLKQQGMKEQLKFQLQLLFLSLMVWHL